MRKSKLGSSLEPLQQSVTSQQVVLGTVYNYIGTEGEWIQNLDEV